MTDPLDYSGKTVLVIGGTSGIGNGIAHGFRERGAVVHVTGTRGSADDYSAEEGSDLTGLEFHPLDVSDRDGIAGFDLPDRLDVVVLCQGIVRYRREEFEREGWDAVMTVNLDSLMDCARAVRAKLADGGGSLIVVSSVGAFHAMIGNPAYAASKAGAVSLVGSLAQAWAAEGIRVNGIAPGLVPTKLTKVTTDNEQRTAGAIARIPAGRMGTPADMAGAALYLASPLADYVVGQTIRVDGGMTLS
ncbi:SDR family oxidoreductase [Qipengyuania sp. XHP0207]|uniref:SDR family NAD(P)-dependent oxidoreductase n=1 Tax=Qipengyuania sp. XHP0207 TaxID=3038078 RepID=UPI00242015E1|nr:SDR family oxidoreductase [Qipengyuania sp. XHP0207]MDG5746839.1 SDR family oxidoreductase [Qipengyuania sp. XHP0207]